MIEKRKFAYMSPVESHPPPPHDGNILAILHSLEIWLTRLVRKVSQYSGELSAILNENIVALS
jgi:hypothetical protein